MKLALDSPIHITGDDGTLCRTLFIEQCRRGGALIYLGRSSIFVEEMIALTYHHYRHQDLRLVQPLAPDTSNTYGPFAAQVAEKLSFLVPDVNSDDIQTVVRSLPTRDMTPQKLADAFAAPQQLLMYVPQASRTYRDLKLLCDHGADFTSVLKVLADISTVAGIVTDVSAPEVVLKTALTENSVVLMVTPEGPLEQLMTRDLVEALRDPDLQLSPPPLIMVDGPDAVDLDDPAVQAGATVAVFHDNVPAHVAAPVVYHGNGKVSQGKRAIKITDCDVPEVPDDLCFPHFALVE